MTEQKETAEIQIQSGELTPANNNTLPKDPRYPLKVLYCGGIHPFFHDILISKTNLIRFRSEVSSLLYNEKSALIVDLFCIFNFNFNFIFTSNNFLFGSDL
jgi:hypothetical protein